MLHAHLICNKVKDASLQQSASPIPGAANKRLRTRTKLLPQKRVFSVQRLKYTLSQ